MKVIKVYKINRFISEYSDSERHLRRFREVVKRAAWRHPADVLKTFGDADNVHGQWVFNICHNKYRLVANIWFQAQMIKIHSVMTHREYDREVWRK